jgi:nucleoside-diphosphate-sugar epimerase
MLDPRYTVVVTGAAGQLGRRLLPQLADFTVFAVDLEPPATGCPIRFEHVDLGQEASCRQLVNLLRESGAASVVHLAFVMDPGRSGVDAGRMWQSNVAGTARVLEAITEVNRLGGGIRKFVFTGGAAAYGPNLPGPVQEDFPLAAHTLPCAVHQQEADEVVRLRAGSLGACTTYLLRPQAYAGAGAENHPIAALRGIPTGTGRLAERYRRRRRRLPLLLPRGPAYLDNQFQFVHVDDMARLIAWILRKQERTPDLHVLNVAGRGPAVSLGRCLEIAGGKTRPLPSLLFRWAVRLRWELGLAALPPEALPYLTGSCTTDTSRLRAFLGGDYERVIEHTVEEALTESVGSNQATRARVENSLTAS